jgi:3-oxoacyl-[acyl-carrier-protein] synthase III
MPYEARFESIGAAPGHPLAAARDCLSRSRYTGADLDCVIDATHVLVEPPTSVSVRRAIGATHATSFHLSSACAGACVLDDLIRRGAIERGMIVSGDAAAIVDRASAPGILLASFRTPPIASADWVLAHGDPFLALHHHLADHKLARGDKVLLLSHGVVLLVVDELETTHGCVH